MAGPFLEYQLSELKVTESVMIHHRYESRIRAIYS